MSIFGRNQQAAAAQNSSSSNSSSSSSNAARSSRPDDMTTRLLSEGNASANTTRLKAPTVAMTSGNAKKSLNFTPPAMGMGGGMNSNMGSGMNASNTGNNEVRKLIVGRDIAMAGEITECDYLVVEGTLDATLRDGQRIEINQTGLFRGAASVTDADIAGRFEGELSVRGRLRVRGSGKISGRIQYGELEIEAGGQIQGEMIVLPPVATEAPLGFPTPANADDNFRATGTGN